MDVLLRLFRLARSFMEALVATFLVPLTDPAHTAELWHWALLLVAVCALWFAIDSTIDHYDRRLGKPEEN